MLFKSKGLSVCVKGRHFEKYKVMLLVGVLILLKQSPACLIGFIFSFSFVVLIVFCILFLCLALFFVVSFCCNLGSLFSSVLSDH